MIGSRLLAACGVALAATLATIAAPASAARPPSNTQLQHDISSVDTSLKSAVKSIDKTTSGLTTSVKTLTSGLAAANAGLASLTGQVASLTAQVAALNTAQAADAVSNAAVGVLSTEVNDPNLGVLAIDAARPRYAAVLAASGQFTKVAASSLEHSVSIVTQSGGGIVLDFGEDVSNRALMVSMAPNLTGVLGGQASVPAGQAIDCGVVTGGCFGDTNPDHVLVTTEVGSTVTAAPFTVVALSG